MNLMVQTNMEEELKLLKFKRDLYQQRDGITYDVVKLNEEIERLEKPSVIRKSISLAEKLKDIEIDDDDYQRDIDHDLSMGAVTE